MHFKHKRKTKNFKIYLQQTDIGRGAATDIEEVAWREGGVYEVPETAEGTWTYSQVLTCLQVPHSHLSRWRRGGETGATQQSEERTR